MGRIKGASIGFAHRGTALKLSARMGASHGGYPNAVKTIGRKNFDPKVYLVTDRRVTAGWKVEEIVEAAIRGDDKSEGVTFVQYVTSTMKNATNFFLLSLFYVAAERTAWDNNNQHSFHFLLPLLNPSSDCAISMKHGHLASPLGSFCVS